MLCLCCCTINICDLSFCACKPFCINVTGMQNDAQATHHKNTTDPLNDAAACNLQETLDATNRMTKSWCPGKVWMPSKLPILPASQACLRSSRLAVPQLSSMSIWGSQARGPAPAHPGACLGWPWGPPAGQPGKRAGMGGTQSKRHAPVVCRRDLHGRCWHAGIPHTIPALPKQMAGVAWSPWDCWREWRVWPKAHLPLRHSACQCGLWALPHGCTPACSPAGKAAAKALFEQGAAGLG